jgi:hypothetical protein
MTETNPDLRVDDRALHAHKRQVLVTVKFATSDGICKTLEGAVGYRAGDALITGVVGETWPVGRERFLRTYDPVPPTLAGQDGQYRSRPSLVLARRLDAPAEVKVGWSRDTLKGVSGDWLVQYAPGEHGIVRDDIFEATYEIDA